MEELDKHRHNIDDIDQKILELLNKRAKEAMSIGEIKKAAGEPLYVPSREKKIFERLTGMNSGPFPNDALRSVYREIISASLSLEEVQKVGYFGPEGTFTNMAAIKQFGLSATLVPVRNIPEVFDSVERGRLAFGVVPVENSLEGVVNHTLDTFTTSNLKICGEIYLEISHNLMSKTGKMDGIKEIYSHYQALGQCRKWLAQNCPDIPVHEIDSTAKAAELAAKDETIAAISGEAAQLKYGLRVVEKSIEDNPNNFTRFLLIGSYEPLPTGNDKTSIVFSVAHRAGSLYEALSVLAKENINMTKIESRPSRQKAWEYVFFVDVEGHIADNKIKTAIDGLSEHTAFLKVLGSYPKGEK
ncbi:MAG: prephenate dehydratase [Deferribacterales bacterium]